jgi:hypothetical protein
MVVHLLLMTLSFFGLFVGLNYSKMGELIFQLHLVLILT